MPRSYPTTRMCDGELLALFEPTVRDSDIFVSTPAKCGQTWLQALLVHLKTRGRQPDLGGKGLGAVSPWLELPGEIGFSHGMTRPARLQTLEGLDDPRIFKMHVLWEEIPRPPGSAAKIVTITRDPRDLPYSMFSHLQALVERDGARPPNDFDAYFEQWMEFGYYFKFVRSFWPHRADPDVLWLRYEDMQRDLRRETERILRFLQWPMEPEDVDRVLPLVDFATMRAAEKSEIFVEHRELWKKDRHFFREGGVGKNREHLNPEQERRIVERAYADFGDECAQFVLSLDRAPA